MNIISRLGIIVYSIQLLLDIGTRVGQIVARCYQKMVGGTLSWQLSRPLGSELTVRLHKNQILSIFGCFLERVLVSSQLDNWTTVAPHCFYALRFQFTFRLPLRTKSSHITSNVKGHCLGWPRVQKHILGCDSLNQFSCHRCLDDHLTTQAPWSPCLSCHGSPSHCPSCSGLLLLLCQGLPRHHSTCKANKLGGSLNLN